LPCLRIKLDPSLVASDDGEWQRQQAPAASISPALVRRSITCVVMMKRMRGRRCAHDAAKSREALLLNILGR